MCDVTVGVRCVESVRKTTGTLFFHEAINSYCSFWLIKIPMDKKLKIRKKCTVSSYNGRPGHVICHRAAVKEFNERVITCKLWLPSTSTHLNPCDYTGKGHSKIAREQNPRSLQEMKDNILKENIIPMQELCCVQRNAISKCDVRYKAGCQHFMTVLQNMVQRTAREIRTPNSRRTPASQRDSSRERRRAQGPLSVLTVPLNPYSIHVPCAKNA